VSEQAPDRKKHAFVSYVHEDDEHVGKMCEVLKAAKIPVWRDKDKGNLGPGQDWKAMIRAAIRSDSIAFLACFSSQSNAKGDSYQNEELTLAVEEFRRKPPGRVWLIPVRFDDCEIPEWDLGAGRTLHGLQRVDLFGDGYMPNAIELIEAIKNIMGEPGLAPDAVRTTVEEASAEDRPRLLRKLTKGMVRDSTREIELDELISEEISRVLAGMRDEARFPTHLTGGTEDEQKLEMANAATDYWELVKPFCSSLQVAARWAAPETLTPWVKGLRAFSAEAMKPLGGHVPVLELRNIPILVSIMVAALASCGEQRWDNFKTLLVDTTVPSPSLQNRRIPVVETVTPWEPFLDAPQVAQLVAHAVITDQALNAALADPKPLQYHTPVPEWIHTILRPLFDEQFPDDVTYDSEFDRAEVMIGLTVEDLFRTRAESETDLPFQFRNKWYGRAVWRSRRYGNAVQDFKDEIARVGIGWPPAKAGLFDGKTDQARARVQQYGETFEERAGHNW
jgi:hypothetical protein